jgi:hypothetical protein
MRRISIPVDNVLYKDYDQKIPHGIRASMLRVLVKIVLNSPAETMWSLAANEEKPELFEIKTKEK